MAILLRFVEKILHLNNASFASRLTSNYVKAEILKMREDMILSIS